MTAARAVALLALCACDHQTVPTDAATDVASEPDASIALFAERFGDPAEQSAFAVAAASDGSIIVVGTLSGTVDFGGGPLASAGQGDVLVAKLDASGHHVWSARFGDASDQWAESVAVDGAGNVAITGSFSGAIDFGAGPLVSQNGRDVFVAVLDATGKLRFAKSFGAPDTNEDGWGVAFDPSGNVLVTGSAEGPIDFGGGAAPAEGEPSIFVAKLDPLGGHVWSHRVGDPLEQIGFAIASDGAGNVLVTGRFEGTIDFGDGAMTAALRDAFVAGYDASGAILFSRRFGGPSGNGMAEGRGIASVSSGIVVAGTFSGAFDTMTSAGDTDVFALGLDLAGTTRFERRFGDASYQNAWTLAPMGTDAFAIAGDFGGTLDLGAGSTLVATAHDAFAAVLDGTSGAASRAWDLRGGTGTAWGVASSGGHVICAGGFSGQLDFGGVDLVSSGQGDVFVGALP